MNDTDRHGVPGGEGTFAAHDPDLDRVPGGPHAVVVGGPVLDGPGEFLVIEDVRAVDVVGVEVSIAGEVHQPGRLGAGRPVHVDDDLHLVRLDPVAGDVCEDDDLLVALGDELAFGLGDVRCRIPNAVRNAEGVRSDGTCQDDDQGHDEDRSDHRRDAPRCVETSHEVIFDDDCRRRCGQGERASGIG